MGLTTNQTRNLSATKKRAGKLTTLTASKQHQQKQQQQKQQHLAEQHSHGLLFLHRDYAETKEKTPSRSNQTKRLGWLGHLFCYSFRRSLWIVYICPISFPPFSPTRSTKQ